MSEAVRREGSREGGMRDRDITCERVGVGGVEQINGDGGGGGGGGGDVVMLTF